MSIYALEAQHGGLLPDMLVCVDGELPLPDHCEPVASMPALVEEAQEVGAIALALTNADH